MDGSEEEGTALVVKARDGDPHALAQLIGYCRPSLHAYLESRVGPVLRRHSSIMDLEQEVLIRIPDLLPRLERSAQYGDFMRLVLQNARWIIHNAVRSGKRFEGESTAPSNPRHQDGQPSQGSITRADENARLEGLLKELDPKLEEVVRLRMAENTFVDIAAKLGIAEATVRKRYMNAARQLRSGWGEDD